MKRQIIFSALCAAIFLSGCGIYGKYKQPETSVDGLYRDTVANAATLAADDTTNMGNLAWEEVFTDPKLQTLIRRALVQNPDLQTAYYRVKEAEATLLSSRLAYTPSLSLAPQGGVDKIFDNGELARQQAATQGSSNLNSWNWSYTLPVAASWEFDIFGKTLNAKRGAKAALLQSEAYRQAVQTQIIASVANCYYTLLMLDRQLAVSEETARLWRESVETMKAMKYAGLVNEAAIAQSEAQSYQIEASLPSLRRQIRETENALCLILQEAPGPIDRGSLEEQMLPTELQAGVPLQLLSNRPDVKSAEMALAGAFYNTNLARSAFYPSLTITGTYGYTNGSGTSILDPAKFIFSALGQLVAPIFSKGANTARLRIATAQYEEARIAFQSALLNAGAEVSDALYLYSSTEKTIQRRDKQVARLRDAVEYTQDLLKYGQSTYLEVLTAQQSLLSAQLSRVSDEFQKMQAVVNLYHALGGGRTDDTQLKAYVKK